MKAAALALTVLTFNAAGPRRVHQGWQSRRAALVEQLNAEAPDLAAFQEVHRQEDAEVLASAAGARERRFDARAGLLLASRLPLGPAESADLGWDAAALAARVETGAGAAEIYAFRLTPGDDELSRARRVAQVVRLSEFVRARSSGTFVLLGDLASSPDDAEARLLMDLLALRDLCVAHGDEVCGRTHGERRVDFVLIPYDSRPPARPARATLTSLAAGDEEDPAPVTPRFGLRAELDSAWLRLRLARAPEGRAEALQKAADLLWAAREAALDAARRASGIPWLGAWHARRLRADAADFGAAEQAARTALARARL